MKKTSLAIYIALILTASASYYYSVETDHDTKITKDKKYKQSTSHCPTSKFLRKILKNNRDNFYDKKDFSFIAGNFKITASDFFINAFDFMYTGILQGQELDYVLKMAPMIYDVEGSNACLAVFSLEDKAASVRLKTEPITLEDIKKLYDSGKLSDIEIENLPQDIKDKL